MSENLSDSIRDIVGVLKRSNKKWKVGTSVTFEHEEEDGKHPYFKLGLKNGMTVRIDGVDSADELDGSPINYRVSYRLSFLGPCGPEGTVEPVPPSEMKEFELSYEWSRLGYQWMTVVVNRDYLLDWSEYAGENEYRMNWNRIEWPGSEYMKDLPHERETFIFQKSSIPSPTMLNPGQKGVIRFSNGWKHPDTDIRVIEGLIVKVNDVEVIGSLKSGRASVKSYEVLLNYYYDGEEVPPPKLIRVAPCDIVPYHEYIANPKVGAHLTEEVILCRSNWR